MSVTKEKESTLSKVTPYLKPLTTENISFYYIPVVGAVNYAGLSVNVMNPVLIKSVFHSVDVTNVLLINSIIGSGLYIYSRKHLQAAPMQKRLLYSGFEAVMFNFGSVLLWAVAKTVAPKSNCISTIMGIVSSAGLIYTGHAFLQYLDSPSSPQSK